MGLKEVQQALIDNMKTWQKVENAAVASTGNVIEKTTNPVIRLMMQIIQQDSQMHYHVQQLIQDSLQKTFTLQPDELGEVWDLIEKHIEIERKTISLAKESLASIEKAKGLGVQAYLLEYLLKDEEKHDAILENLSLIKKGMYPYG